MSWLYVNHYEALRNKSKLANGFRSPLTEPETAVNGVGADGGSTNFNPVMPGYVSCYRVGDLKGLDHVERDKRAAFWRGAVCTRFRGVLFGSEPILVAAHGDVGLGGV